jgi:DNA-binding CsgD family transcriptional regulator
MQRASNVGAEITAHAESFEGESESETPSGYHPTAKALLAASSRARKPWEIVEEFEHQGFFYRLQRRIAEAPQDTPLARREEEVLDLASAGLSRKEIATQLGLATSTIRVLLHRAAVKLRANSRVELLAYYRQRLEDNERESGEKSPT